MSQKQSLIWKGFHSENGHFEVTFQSPDSALIGQSLNLRLKLKLHPVIEPPGRREHMVFGMQQYSYEALDKSKIIYVAPFTVADTSTLIAIPVKSLAKAYPYQGHTLELVSEIQIEHQGKILCRLAIESEWLPFQDNTLENQAPVRHQSSEESVLTRLEKHESDASYHVPDQINLVDSIKSVPAQQQVLVTTKISLMIASLILAGVLIYLRTIYIDDSMIQKGGYLYYPHAIIGGYLILGTFYILPRMIKKLKQTSFASYIDFQANQPALIRPRSQVKLSHLFTASSHITLNNLRVRILAVQEERFVYRMNFDDRENPSETPTEIAVMRPEDDSILVKEVHHGPELIQITSCENGSRNYDYQYTHVSNHCVIFDRVLQSTLPNEPIQNVCQDVLDLDDFFATMLPPAILTPHWGVNLEWRVQFIHPQLKDLEFPLPKFVFDPRDFLEPVSLKKKS